MSPAKLDTALALARRGFHVFPVHYPDDGHCSCGTADCSSPAKHPIGRLLPHGLKDATTDAGAIARGGRKSRWRTSPLRPRRASLVVLDVDPRHGGDDSLEQLEALVGTLETAIVQHGRRRPALLLRGQRPADPVQAARRGTVPRARREGDAAAPSSRLARSTSPAAGTRGADRARRSRSPRRCSSCCRSGTANL